MFFICNFLGKLLACGFLRLITKINSTNFSVKVFENTLGHEDTFVVSVMW